jgi:Brp/Blh family beta-carotene 15,15'-monooxygenase
MKIEFKQSHQLHQSHLGYLTWGTILFVFLAVYGITTGYKLDETSTLIACSFLILTIGISHGALDHEKGKKLFKIYKIKNISIFYVTYLILGILIAFMWFFFPEIILIIFLTVASYHFGKEDCIHPSIKNSLLFATKGSLIIWAPLLFHFNNTLAIFEILHFGGGLPTLSKILIYLYEGNFILFFLILSILSNYFIFKTKLVKVQSLVEVFIVLVINFLYYPVVAFTFYFCFLHSIRHSISLILEMKINSKIFFKKALPLTFITAVIFIVSAWVIILNNYSLNGAILKVTFIGLASLTFPHILLEYLLEKNGK